MSIAATILAAAQSAFEEDAGCVVKIGRNEFNAICTGIDELRAATDQGIMSGYIGNVRYLSSVEGKPVNAGDVINIKRLSDKSFIKVRVGSRHEIGGAVRLTIAAEFE